MKVGTVTVRRVVSRFCVYGGPEPFSVWDVSWSVCELNVLMDWKLV